MFVGGFRGRQDIEFSVLGQIKDTAADITGASPRKWRKKARLQSKYMTPAKPKTQSWIQDYQGMSELKESLIELARRLPSPGGVLYRRKVKETTERLARTGSRKKGRPRLRLKDGTPRPSNAPGTAQTGYRSTGKSPEKILRDLGLTREQVEAMTTNMSSEEALIELARGNYFKQIAATRKSADKISRAMKPRSARVLNANQSDKYPKYTTPTQKKNQKLIEKAKEMRANGASQMQIAQATGRTQSWVSKHLRASA